jgi:hypothetical protein
MALGGKLMGLGMGLGEIQSVAGELFETVRDKMERIRWARSS